MTQSDVVRAVEEALNEAGFRYRFDKAVAREHMGETGTPNFKPMKTTMTFTIYRWSDNSITDNS